LIAGAEVRETLRSDDNDAVYAEMIPETDKELVKQFLIQTLGYTESRASEALA
jgi:hypothetical protein